jgi:hypothetical protein
MSHPIWSTQQQADTILMAWKKMRIAFHSSSQTAVNNTGLSVPPTSSYLLRKKRFGPQGRTVNKCWQASKSPPPPNLTELGRARGKTKQTPLRTAQSKRAL